MVLEISLKDCYVLITGTRSPLPYSTQSRLTEMTFQEAHGARESLWYSIFFNKKPMSPTVLELLPTPNLMSSTRTLPASNNAPQWEPLWM